MAMYGLAYQMTAPIQPPDKSSQAPEDRKEVEKKSRKREEKEGRNDERMDARDLPLLYLCITQLCF